MFRIVEDWNYLILHIFIKINSTLHTYIALQPLLKVKIKGTFKTEDISVSFE